MNYTTTSISVLLVILCTNLSIAQDDQFCPLQINAPGILLFNPAFSGLLCEYDVFGTLKNTSKSTPLLTKELTTFQAISTTNADVVLKWETKHQRPSQTFEILRSTDRRSFKRIGIKNQADAGTEKTYTFLDAQPIVGNNYYLIRKVDHSNGVLASAIQKVYINHQRPFSLKSSLSLQQNQLVLNYQTNQEGIYTLNISDETADVIVFKEVKLQPGNNQFEFCIPKAGKYYVLLYNREQFFTDIFIKTAKNQSTDIKKTADLSSL